MRQYCLVRFDTKTISGGMTFGVPITEFHYVNVGGSYESTEINTNPFFLDPRIARFLFLEGNKYDLFRLQTSFSYDTRNAAIFPDRGTLQRIMLQTTTPGGDLRYWKAEYDSRVFIPLVKNYTLMLKGLLGYGDAYGDTTELPFFENFYAGGPRTVRGYEEFSLGPEDIFGRALGGNIMVVGNAELILPVPFLEEIKSVRLSGFFDAGNVYASSEKFDLGQLRMSVGLADLMSPFGMLSVSVAQPFRDQRAMKSSASSSISVQFLRLALFPAWCHRVAPAGEPGLGTVPCPGLSSVPIRNPDHLEYCLD